MIDISPGKEERSFSLEKGSSPPLEGLELPSHGGIADGHSAAIFSLTTSRKNLEIKLCNLDDVRCVRIRVDDLGT